MLLFFLLILFNNRLFLRITLFYLLFLYMLDLIASHSFHYNLADYNQVPTKMLYIYLLFFNKLTNNLHQYIVINKNF